MLGKFLARHEAAAYWLLRTLAGLMFAFHGVQKIFGVLADHQPAVGSQIWVGGIIELVSGFAIALNRVTVCAAFVASGTMAVAYVQFHWKGALNSQFLPAINKGELAALYSLVFLYIACRGRR